MSASKNKHRMSHEDKCFIYQTLRRNFAFDEEHPLANLGWCFVHEGINKEDYGFLKLKPMLEEMADFVVVSQKEIGGVPQSMFQLRACDCFESDSDDSEKAVEMQKSEKETKSEINTNNETESSKNKDIKALKSNLHENGDIDSKNIVTTKKNEDIDTKAEVEKEDKAGKESKSEKGSSQKKEINKQEDKKSEIDSNNQKVTQSKNENNKQEETHNQKQIKQEIESNSKNKTKKQIDTKAIHEEKQQKPQRHTPVKRISKRVIPGKALERFAYLGNWQDFLSALAALALEEPWDFNGHLAAQGAWQPSSRVDVRPGRSVRSDVPRVAPTPSKRFDILHNYIRYTFYRLFLEDKVAFSEAEDFAAFNTGLVDRHYEDIYACFEPSDPETTHYPWTFSGFCTKGTGRLGKRLVREMNPLPQPASYLERKEDLLFDLDRELVCDVKHIVVDNVHRLPREFLRGELASSQECLDILDGIDAQSEIARGERFERLRRAIESDARLFNRLSNSINAAIDVAKRQVRWNYKTAVPAYYPRTNSMNLLLPLNLTEDNTPDVALVVELQKSGNYQGQTIVTMAQAYRDARLLCRPYIDWLSPASIIDAASEEEEDE